MTNYSKFKENNETIATEKGKRHHLFLRIRLCGNLIWKYKRDNKVSLIPIFKIGIWNAWTFMSVFLLQMLAIMFVDKRVWERSHIPKDARRNKLERYVGIIGNFVWLIAMGYSVFLPIQLGTTWFYIGLFVFIIGLTLMVIATINFIATPADQLITKGAYNFSRHPMYLATFFICLGSGIATVSWLFILLSIIMALCFYQEALIEERYCFTRYGNVYKDYINRTHRWIGVPKKYNKWEKIIFALCWNL